ncbi:MAG TPA: phosphoribosylamine--glycine ligase [Bacteroidales bacterium]|nr:phosphoribosylamine--glycine ligase [Bacteroidales bacterium]
MNVLILGSGGREHALAYQISKSNVLSKLFVAPGNAGTAQIAENIKISVNDFNAISEFVIQNNINIIVVGPEDPLVSGIVDFFRSKSEFNNLHIIGPDKLGAKLEGSKDFAKEFMFKYNIPTASYFCANSSNYKEAKNYLSKLNPPYVLKADGLAAGKGVLILNDYSEAIFELKNILDGKFGSAGNKVVIEEFLDGIECSAFALTDGESYVILPEAKDYKRIGENNTGLNTGGMGAVSPVPFYNKDFANKVEERIIKPTIAGIKQEKMNYCGFVFFGLMNVSGNPYVIEYNVRMGDPETEAVLPRIKSDFLEVLINAAEKTLKNVNLELATDSTATIILVSGGYPGSYEKNKKICGIDKVKDSIVFHSGTVINEDCLVSAGGRVLAISSYGKDIFEALEKSYCSAKKIHFENMYYRKDLGFDLK